MDPHLSAEDIAGVIDGELPANRRTAAEEHLVECSECRSELVAASELADSVPIRPRLPIRRVGLAAAAIIMLAVVPLLRARHSTSSTDLQRFGANDVTTVETVWPTSGASAPIDSLTFAWHAVPGASRYHLLLIDSVGSPVLDRSTADTVAGPIRDAHVSPGSRYFWYVDAISDDGTSVASRSIGFFIRAR